MQNSATQLALFEVPLDDVENYQFLIQETKTSQIDFGLDGMIFELPL